MESAPTDLRAVVAPAPMEIETCEIPGYRDASDSRGRLSLRRLERVNFRDIDAQVLHPAPKCAIMKSERRRRYEKRGIFKGRKHIHMF